MPVVMATTVRRIKQEVKIRRSQSMLPKSEQSSAYKSVPPPKSVGNGATSAGTVAANPPPPYRQPPLPADPPSSAASVTAANGPTVAANSSNAIHHVTDCSVLDGHGLLAYSSKFPIDRELVVTTNDKIAEVGRIEVPAPTTSAPASSAASAEAGPPDMAPTVTAANQTWADRNRHVGDVGVAHYYGPPSLGAESGVTHGHAHHLGHMAEELHRPASYMPMHVHYTGWAAQNNYVAMNGTAYELQQQQRALNGLQDTSLSFDSSGPLRLDPVFAPAPGALPPAGVSSTLTQYEIHVDSAERPSTVTVAPWNTGDVSDTSTFDRLRDTCNKMFLRDGHLRGSSQFALSPNLPRALEHLTIETDDPPAEVAATTAPSAEVKSGEPETKSGGSMRKKLTGKTYHSIKDMFTTKFSGKSSKNKVNGTEEGAEGSAEAKAQRPAETAPKANERSVDSIHSINQRIHSQLANQSQVWGSYGRSAKLETTNSTLNDVDTSALAKLTLNSTQETPNSPFSLRHQKPSVTFRMDLNECQYNANDNVDPNHMGPYRTTQGQVILYDDTMHFPQQQQPQQVKDLKSYGEHDSSMSSITSAPVTQKRSNFTYGDYDIPPNKGSLNSTLSPTEGLSSGHQSAGSSSDLDKRSGQSVSTCDSGLGVNTVLDNGRSRSAVYQGLQLDTSTETEVFIGRQVSSQVHNHEWMNEAADREVKTAMETQTDQQPSSRSRNFNGRLNTSGEQSIGDLHGQSATPPLPPLSPDCSPKATPKLEQKFSNSKPDLLEPTSNSNGFVQRNNHAKQNAAHAGKSSGGNGNSSAVTGTSAPTAHRSSNEGKQSDHRSKRRQHEDKTSKHHVHSSKTRSKMAMHPLTALQEALDLGEITSTTTGLELDGDSDSGSSHSEEHSDDDLSTTLDVTAESRTIRRQLEGLESMYSEVLKALHKKSRTGASTSGGLNADYKLSKRRMYGSVSSLPSSVCSRPVYRDRRRNDDRQRRNAVSSKESKGVNKRFQRLESHVVTLARSVAHLSSEMRTQHIMIQEMETIRNEIAQLRSHPLRMSTAGHSGVYGKTSRYQHRLDRDSCWQGAVPALTDPSRVKKLTSFFGDEPPLLRIFLKKLGYEKYAPLFDQEKIGMIELPYLTEERLHKMGIPMGPRIRILQEAQLSQTRCSDSLSVYGIV